MGSAVHDLCAVERAHPRAAVSVPCEGGWPSTQPGRPELLGGGRRRGRRACRALRCRDAQPSVRGLPQGLPRVTVLDVGPFSQSRRSKLKEKGQKGNGWTRRAQERTGNTRERIGESTGKQRPKYEEHRWTSSSCPPARLIFDALDTFVNLSKVFVPED